MKRALFIAILLASAISCRHGDLYVRVLYSGANPATPKFQQAQREFSFTDPRLQSSKPFFLAQDVTRSASIEVGGRWTAHDIDLFILKSAAELPDVPELRKSMGDSFSVCGQAVAYIPEWVSEERREGAARFLQYLSTHCR
jgi:hypothetical protein